MSGFDLLLLDLERRCRHTYRWSDDTINGVRYGIHGESLNGNDRTRGVPFNPIEALVRTCHNGQRNDKYRPMGAGIGFLRIIQDDYGLTPKQTQTIMEAIYGTSNRGNVQVIRGRIKKALGL